MVSSQHLIPHGGIGQFVKGFIEMVNTEQWIVDVILDKKPYNTQFVEYIRGLSGNIIYPATPLDSSTHTNIFSFSDTYNLERMVNFRDAIMQAFQKNLYDMILINTPEALVSAYGLNFNQYLPVVFYTHNENLVFNESSFTGVFNPTFDEFFLNVSRCEHVILGTQTERNVVELKNNKFNTVVHLPMPMTERKLLDASTCEKDGVLFIGRWEERKNPKEFLRVIEKTGYKAKVMTNARGAKKFEEELKKLGVEYDVRAEIIGDEKVDFIKSARVMYMPSKSESYGFALFESLGHCPCVVLNEYEWWKNFADSNVIVTDKKNVVSAVQHAYENFTPGDIEYVKRLDDGVKHAWCNLVNNFQPKQSNNESSKILTKDDLYYSDHVASLNRFASTEDVISVLGNRQKFQLIYTNTETWLSSKGNAPNVVESAAFSLDSIDF